jgi:membrane protein
MSKKSVTKTSSDSIGTPVSPLSKIQQFMLLCLPFCLFFSYHPVIPILSTATTNFELSLPLLWLLIFAVLSLPGAFRFYVYSLRAIIKPKQPIGQLHRSSSSRELSIFYAHFIRILSPIYPLYTTVNAIDSPNFPRAILTSGVIWCIYISLLTILKNISQYKNQIGKNIKKNLLIAGASISVFCWLQSILDIAGAPREITFLCEGCTSTVFGFPHPNGLAIEPQFMANLLLAPIFLSLFYLFEGSKKQDQKLNPFPYPASKVGRALCYGLPLFLIATLYLTLSRGAIFSFWVGIFILFIYKTVEILKQKACILKDLIRQSLLFSAVVFLSLFFTLSAQGVFTELGPTTHTFFDGISTSVNQLSLGRIDLAKIFHKNSENNRIHKTSELDEQLSSDPKRNPASSVPKTPQFTGYIAESTEIRLNLNRLALSSWQTSFSRLFDGVGLGAAGPTLYKEFPELGSPKEIIQNEYLAILYEQGICGAVVLLLNVVLLVLIYKQYNKKHEKSAIYGRVLILSFALTLCFFSGLPNALHIYLLPILFF